MTLSHEQAPNANHPGQPPQGWAPPHQQQQPPQQQQYQQMPPPQNQFPPQQMQFQQHQQQQHLPQGPPQVLKGPPQQQQQQQPGNVHNGNGTHQLTSNLGQMNLGNVAPPPGANSAYPPQQQQPQQPPPNQARPPNMMSPQVQQQAPPQTQLPPQQQAPPPQQQQQNYHQQQPNYSQPPQQQQQQQPPFGAGANQTPSSDIPVSAAGPPSGPFGQPAPPPTFKELPNNSTLPAQQPPAPANAFGGAFPPQRYNAGPPQGSAMPPAPQANMPPGPQGHLPPQAHLPPGPQSNLPPGPQSHLPSQGYLPPGPQGHLPPGPPQGHLPPGPPQGHLPPGPQGFLPPGPQGNLPPGPHMPPPGSHHNPNGPHMPPMPNRGPPGHPAQPGYAGQPGYGAPPGHYPQPGHGPHNGTPGHHGGPGHYPAPAAEPQRRLDPDNMPNPIQVMAENQRTITGPFITNQAGLVPPLVTTKFVTHDQGNSGPKFIRSTMYNVPTTTDIMKQTQVPFALIVSPFANTGKDEILPPIVDFGAIGPIRCGRCKAYMSPNMQFIDAGRRFQCMLCKATTEVPQEYFQHLDHTGQRVDKFERPELVLGTYEFVATQDYCRSNKKPTKAPALIFVIDVSYNNIKSGLVKLICSEMKSIISKLPVDQGAERTAMKVGFITYNNSVHFYNIKNNLAVPQMMVVGDINEIFMPLLDGFLCDAEESSSVIDILMEQIPTMFAETRETETILMPAIQAGLEALKASDCAGKLLVFHSSLPVSEAPGKLKNRDDRNVLGTDKEKTVLSPQCTTYNNLGQDCVQNGCSVDLFIFNNSYIDLATIGQICRLTGGEIYKYTYFQADLDGERVIRDVQKNVASTYAFDTVMRVRTSTGVRPTDFYGHFFMSNTTDMEIAHIDRNKSVAIEIKHDDKLPQDENVYIQVAVLYTSCGGQRRLRILNLALTACSQMSDLFRCGDLDAVVLFFAKRIMFKLLESSPRAIKEELEQRCAQILACYRKNCASPTSAGQLILPECMKLLPLYVSCLLKNDAVSGGSDMTCDDRSYAMQFVLTMDLPTSVSFFYPRLIPIHNVDPNETGIPSQIRTSIDKITDDGAYILENGVHMFVWLGLALAPEFVQSVFGAPCSQQVDTEACRMPRFDNALSQRVHQIIDQIQTEKPHCMRITLVRQRDKLENVFKHFLIEDAGLNGAASYVDYLCHLHKEIRSLLSFSGK